MLEHSGDDHGPSGVRLAPGVVVPRDCLRFTFVATSGPGGQNVNKRATKCQLRVALAALPISPGASRRLAALAGRQLTDDGEILIACDDNRSQERNRAECVARLGGWVAQALVSPKPRKPTKPTRGSRERRLTEKKRRSDTKRRRGDTGD